MRVRPTIYTIRPLKIDSKIEIRLGAIGDTIIIRNII